MDLMDQIDLFPLVMLATCQKWKWGKCVLFFGAFFKVVTITDDAPNKAGTRTKEHWKVDVCKYFLVSTSLISTLDKLVTKKMEPEMEPKSMCNCEPLWLGDSGFVVILYSFVYPVKLFVTLSGVFEL